MIEENRLIIELASKAKHVHTWAQMWTQKACSMRNSSELHEVKGKWLPNIQHTAPLSDGRCLCSSQDHYTSQEHEILTVTVTHSLPDAWLSVCSCLLQRSPERSHGRQPQVFLQGNTTLLWVPHNTRTTLLRLQTAEV